jgi:AmpE protein
MTFIITFIALIIERFFHWSHLRQWRWFNQYQHWLGARVGNWSSGILLAACVLSLVAAVGVINFLLKGWFYEIPEILFGIVVLLYCMGPNNLWAQAFGCLSELHKDPQIAIMHAQATFGIPTPSNSQAFHQSLTSSLFIAAQERIFAVIFWFVILGPVGAVIYRSIALCANQSDLGLTQIAAKIQRWLDWMPARIFTFLFALAGHFVAVFNVWKKEVKSGIEMNEKLVAECGMAAIKNSTVIPEDGSAEKAALELLDRVFIITIVILAMMVLIIT